MIELYFSTVKILAQRPTHISATRERERERERGGGAGRERENERTNFLERQTDRQTDKQMGAF